MHQLQCQASQPHFQIRSLSEKTSPARLRLEKVYNLRLEYANCKSTAVISQRHQFLRSQIVNGNYFVRLKIRVGHDKSDTGEESTHVPFDFTDNPSRFIPFLRLVTQLDHPSLYPALWGTAGSASRSVEYAALEAAVAGKPDEVGDATVFAELVEPGTGKCRIPRSQNCLNQDRYRSNQRRNKIDDAIG